MNFDLNKIRSETPGCHDKLFFNSAGSSLPPKCVTDIIKNYLEEEQFCGGYFLKEKFESEIRNCKKEIVHLINTKEKNIALSYNATDAMSKALSSITFKSGDVVFTTDDDYVSNQFALISLEKRIGIQLIRTRNLESGGIDFNDLDELINRHKPKSFVATHCPSNSGLIQDVERIGAICHKYNILFVLDACQSVGQLPVDVQKINCDFLCATSRKFLRGPRGTGFLYVSDKILKSDFYPLFIDLNGATWTNSNSFEVQKSAQRFEYWENNYALVLGLGAAVKYSNSIGMETIAKENKKLVDRFRNNINSIPKIKIMDRGDVLSSIITLQIQGIEKIELKNYLEKASVYFSFSNSTIALIDFKKKNIDYALRISPHYFNSIEEIDRLCLLLEQIK